MSLRQDTLNLLLFFASLGATALHAQGASAAEGQGAGQIVAQADDGIATEPDDDGRGTPYKVDKDDNICGLSEPRQLTNPAKVDHEALMDLTSEVQELKKHKIDVNSAKGIELMSKARAKVLAACEAVRADKGHCSIWKTIERRDGKPIADVTEAAKALL